MKIGIVRGAFLNQWEMQNYAPLAKKHDVVAFSSLKPLSQPKDIPVVKLPSPTDLPKFPGKMPILNRIFTDAHYLLGLERKLEGFDIAHTAETYYHYTQQCLEAKKAGLVGGVVCTVWETIPFNNEGIWGRKEFKERAIKEVDFFITPTARAKKALIKEGAEPGKIKVIRMGVDIKKFGTRAKSKTLTILFVGRREKEKGVGELLEVFKQLQKNYKVKLTMIGEGTRRVPYDQMPQEYAAADIFVLPSKSTKHWEEQYGMVLVEAMASGLPIVTTDCGAIPEVVGKAAIVVRQGEIKPLYRRIEELIRSKKKRQEWGEKARKRAEKLFDVQTTAQEIEKVYQTIVRRRESRQGEESKFLNDRKIFWLVAVWTILILSRYLWAIWHWR